MTHGPTYLGTTPTRIPIASSATTARRQRTGSKTEAGLANLWIRERLVPDAAAHVASAIAMAESHGNPTATNHDTDGSTDRGSSQINSIHGALSICDAMGNVRAAIKISSNGQNWMPWSTYKNGAYRAFRAMGGVVHCPTNIVAGEAGPDAISPLSKFKGGGITYVFNVNGFHGDRATLIRQLRNEFVRPGPSEGSIFGGLA